MKAAPKKLSQRDVTHAQIALRAYEFFAHEGFVHGNDIDHWLRAERELQGVATVASAKRVAGTRARP